MLQAVAQYEMDHIGVSFLPNPLWDEGFRVKRYDPADSSSEKVRLPAGSFWALCQAIVRIVWTYRTIAGSVLGYVSRHCASRFTIWTDLWCGYASE